MNNLTTIKIGPVTYKVERVLRLLGSKSDGTSEWLNGRCRTEKALLETEAELPDDVDLVAIYHEMFHAICSQAGIEDQPEPVIIALSYGTVQVLQDNPQLVELTMEPKRQAYQEAIKKALNNEVAKFDKRMEERMKGESE